MQVYKFQNNNIALFSERELWKTGTLEVRDIELGFCCGFYPAWGRENALLLCT